LDSNKSDRKNKKFIWTGIPDINKYLFHFSIGHAERKLHRMEMKSHNFYLTDN